MNNDKKDNNNVLEAMDNLIEFLDLEPKKKGEILIDENGIEYLNCSPAILGTDGEDAGSLFEQTQPGNAYQRLVTQLSWIGTIAREGALFDVIGRKKGAAG